MLKELKHQEAAPAVGKNGDDAKKHWLKTPTGRVIKPVRFLKGRPVYKYEDLVQLGPPYSEDSWE